MSSIWTPGGSRDRERVLPDDVRTAIAAIEAYSPDLELGVDKNNEQWVVMWKDAVGKSSFPVLGLGYELPGYEEIQRRLYSADTQKHGAEIVHRAQRRQAEYEKQQKEAHHEVAQNTAEHLEHAFHKVGKTDYKRVFIPKGVTV